MSLTSREVKILNMVRTEGPFFYDHATGYFIMELTGNHITYDHLQPLLSEGRDLLRHGALTPNGAKQLSADFRQAAKQTTHTARMMNDEPTRR